MNDNYGDDDDKFMIDFFCFSLVSADVISHSEADVDSHNDDRRISR